MEHKEYSINYFYLSTSILLGGGSILLWDTPFAVCFGLILTYTSMKIKGPAKKVLALNGPTKKDVKEVAKETVDEITNKAMQIADKIYQDPFGSFRVYIPYLKNKFNLSYEEENILQSLCYRYGMRLEGKFKGCVEPEFILFDKSLSLENRYNTYINRFEKIYSLRDVFYLIDDRIIKSFGDEKYDNSMPDHMAEYETDQQTFLVGDMIFTRRDWKVLKKIVGKENIIPMTKKELEKEKKIYDFVNNVSNRIINE